MALLPQPVGVLKDVIHQFKPYIRLIIPLAVMVLRWVITRIATNKFETAKALLAVPEQLVFISITLLLAGAAGLVPSFEAHFPDSYERLAAIVISFLGLCVAAMIVGALMFHVCEPTYQKFLVVDSRLGAIKLSKVQPRRFPATNTSNLLQLWGSTAFIFSITWAATMLIALLSIWWTFKVID